MANANITLFTNKTDTGTSQPFIARPVNIGLSEQTAETSFLQFAGTLDGATVTLEGKAPDGNYYSTGSDDQVLIAANVPGMFELTASDYAEYRLNISTVGASTDISAWVKNGKFDK